MLSILIPVYNFDVIELIENLDSQARKAKIDFEIIAVDDASEDKYKTKNRKINTLPNVRYFEESQNNGRARVRNKLAEYARFNNLLFIDCDSEILDKNFILNYLEHCRQNEVICGGLEYVKRVPQDKSYYLRWLYGTKREYKNARDRNKNPNASFSSFNFLINKDVFDQIKFNETITNYGHEDTLFGYELKKRNIIIKHIDNPMVHIGLETNEEFIKKTKEGIENLKQLMKQNGYEKVFIKDITLLNYFKFLQRIRLSKLFRYLFNKLEKRLYNYLVKNKPNILFFDLFKLGYLCSIN
ncbi:MAG: glycosyltransferase family 2 protein [Bacteroidales bacterium]|nr:MAG: glycosyltransferase family 2 protein [Bacteroidales bacterium]